MYAATRVAGLDDVAFSTPAQRSDRCVVDIGIPCVGWVVVLVSAFPTPRWTVALAPRGFLCRVVAPYAAMGFPRAGPPTSLHPVVQGLGSIHPDMACVAVVGISWSVWLFVTLALGIEEVRGGKEEGGHEYCPLVFLPPQFLRRARMEWSLWKRVGVVLLRLLGRRWLGPHPSREGRGVWYGLCA